MSISTVAAVSSVYMTVSVICPFSSRRDASLFCSRIRCFSVTEGTSFTCIVRFGGRVGRLMADALMPACATHMSKIRW